MRESRSLGSVRGALGNGRPYRERIREHYPNALALTYERDESAQPILLRGSALAKLDDPIAVVGEFLDQVRGNEGTEDEMALIASALKELGSAEERL